MTYILGIDPDLTMCSCALMVDGGATWVYADKVKLPKKSSKYAQTEKIALASQCIRGIVSDISDLNMRGDCVQVYLEHQSAAHAKREQKIKWQDLLDLAHVSGIWTGALSADLGVPAKNIHIVYAATWKQQQPKWINQTRTLTALGLEYEKKGGKKPYPVPLQEQIGDMFCCSKYKPNPGDFKDINDSLGIALYGYRMWGKYIRKKGV